MLKSILPVLLPKARRAVGYLEPFLGSGAVARAVLAALPDGAQAILSDSDPWVVAVWRASAERPDELVDRVRRFQPRAEAFYEFRDRELLGPPDHPGAQMHYVDAALQKLALHAMSFGGLGALAGSPIGGMKQTGKYKVGCRWSPPNLEREIRRTARLCSERRVTVLCTDFRQVLGAMDFKPGWLAYLDPPYWSAGPVMYRRSFGDADHEDLAAILERAPFSWVLSYDDDRRVIKRYAGWARVYPIEGTTQGGGGRGERRRTELLLSDIPRPNVSVSNILGVR